MVESLGTPRARLSPLALSKIYNSVCLTSLCYGAEVWCPSDSSVQDLETVHQQIGRRIQGLPANTSRPASHSTLGWRPIEACFDLAKLLWVWRLLKQSHTSVYQRLAVQCLVDSRFHGGSDGPFSIAYRVSAKYKLTDALNSLMESGTMMSRSAWKRLCETTVRAWHENMWRMMRMMYPRLDIFSEVVPNIETCVWWTVCKANPRMINSCKRVMKLITGESNLNAHKGRYVNKTSSCMLCRQYVTETVTHMIAECDALAEHRDSLWTLMLDYVPLAMAQSMQIMGPREKTLYILSGLRAKYTAERQQTYEAMALFVETLYTLRGHYMANL